METSNKVSIREIIKELKLKVVYMPDDVDYYVYSQDINRPDYSLQDILIILHMKEYK